VEKLKFAALLTTTACRVPFCRADAAIGGEGRRRRRACNVSGRAVANVTAAHQLPALRTKRRRRRRRRAEALSPRNRARIRRIFLPRSKRTALMHKEDPGAPASRFARGERKLDAGVHKPTNNFLRRVSDRAGAELVSGMKREAGRGGGRRFASP